MPSAPWSSNKIYYRVSDYGTLEDMIADLVGQVSYLLMHSYWVSCYKSPADNNFYVVEFASQDPSINNHIPVWLSPDDFAAAPEEQVKPIGGDGGSGHAA